MSATLTQPPAADYQAAFDAERLNEYPVVDAFEARMGFKVDRARLEAAARVLACPLKNNPPNWQHGRVLYAAARKYLAACPDQSVNVLDIGTAKGFSALCLRWAVDDSLRTGVLVSVDVLNPLERVRRNTVAEVGGLKTLAETLAPWPEVSAAWTRFVKRTGVDELSSGTSRIHIAFVDGKHTGAVVAEEGRLLAERQYPGDLVIFDDLHLPDIAKAVQGLSDLYELEILRILPNRAYAIGVRR